MTIQYVIFWILELAKTCLVYHQPKNFPNPFELLIIVKNNSVECDLIYQTYFKLPNSICYKVTLWFLALLFFLLN